MPSQNYKPGQLYPATYEIVRNIAYTTRKPKMLVIDEAVKMYAQHAQHAQQTQKN